MRYFLYCVCCITYMQMAAASIQYYYEEDIAHSSERTPLLKAKPEKKMIQLSQILKPIEVFPIEYLGYTSLKKLEIIFSHLSELPPQISQLINLEILTVTSAKLHTLPDTLKDLPNLQRVGLAGNEFTTFPKVLLDMPKVTLLNIGFNRIRIIPDKISRLSNLEELWLTHNPLYNHTLPINHLAKLKKLKVLDLHAIAFSDRALGIELQEAFATNGNNQVDIRITMGVHRR